MYNSQLHKILQKGNYCICSHFIHIILTSNYIGYFIVIFLHILTSLQTKIDGHISPTINKMTTELITYFYFKYIYV